MFYLIMLDCEKTLSEFAILLRNYLCFMPVSTRLAGPPQRLETYKILAKFI